MYYFYSSQLRHTALGLTLIYWCLAANIFGNERFTSPDSPRKTYSLNVDWKFTKPDQPDSDIPQFAELGFNDAAWPTISIPHSFNETDTFRTIISHGGGDRGGYKGLAFYRKHFKLPEAAKASKVFIEFEGMHQAG